MADWKTETEAKASVTPAAELVLSEAIDGAESEPERDADGRRTGQFDDGQETDRDIQHLQKI